MTSPKDSFCDQLTLVTPAEVRTIFDIGANIGQTSAVYANLFPEAVIYAFEPFPDAFEQLGRKFSGNSLVRPIQLAISNKVGKSIFYVNRNSVTNSCLPSATESRYWVTPANEIENLRTIEVPVTTVDEFCRQAGISTIQILKIDIQGGDLMALQGAKEKLSHAAISLIYTEVDFVPIYEGQAFFHEIAAFLFGYGYSLFDIYNVHYHENGQAKWGDAIFISPQLRDSQLQNRREDQPASSVAVVQPEPLAEPAAEQHSSSAIRELEAKLASARDTLADREQEVASLRDKFTHLEDILAAVQNSVGWRALNAWRRTRERLAPEGSFRRTIYDSLLRCLGHRT